MTSQRPNILLITSDQQHYGLLGCEDPRVSTPHLDRLAAEGTLFQRAYCPNPTCTPSRASIITGLYPSQHGAWSLGTSLRRELPTLGGILSGQGYRTSLVGKAHFEALGETPDHPSLESYPRLKDLDFWRGFDGPYFGFDKIRLCRNHADEFHAGEHYALWMEQRGLKDWEKHFPLWNPALPDHGGKTRKEPGAWSLPEEFHYNHFIVEESLEVIRAASDAERPFFLWSSFPDPHPPYLVPEPWASMFEPDESEVPEFDPREFATMPPHYGLTQEEKPDFSPWHESNPWNHGFHSHRFDHHKQAERIAIYKGMMAFTDAAIGRLLDGLKASGLDENTLVVFTSDHGHFYGQHGLVAKGPFMYEDLIRVPFLARWPGQIPAGQRSSDLVSLVDLAPTFLAAAGLEPPPWMSGLDLSAAWCGEPAARRRDHVLVEHRHQPSAIHVRTYVDERYKLTIYYGREYGELFDLREDPGERRNMWDDPAQAELRSRLLQKMLDAELIREPLVMPRVSGA